MLESGKYSLHHVKGECMKADIGTKPLPAPRFQHLVSSLGMTEPSPMVARKVRQLDFTLEEKVRVLLTCLVVASLISPADAQRELISVPKELELGPIRAGSGWQFLVLVVVVICVWEVVKLLVRGFSKGCFWVISKFCSVCPRVEPGAVALTVPSTEGTGLHVFHHVDDVMILGPRRQAERQAEQVMEELTAPEGPGAPLPMTSAARRRRSAQPGVFQFCLHEVVDWRAVLDINLSPVGQDRYEYRQNRPHTVLRWHVSARTRLFVPEGTRLPVELTRFTGRRRTWLITKWTSMPS